MKEYNKQLEGYELFTSLEPCLMCLGKAYWSGIRKITYVLAKEDVDQKLAYESTLPTQQIVTSLNDGLVLTQDSELFDDAIKIYKLWEDKQ